VSPKLRKLMPDQALFRRRAGDEPLRELARDYHVQHEDPGTRVRLDVKKV
jgi:hypothetical protein